jgi:HSP20 family molecular chaperone IbpA
MKWRERSAWFWGDALSALEQAERLQQMFFNAGRPGTRSWEPPVDVVEDEASLTVHVALPGVPASAVSVQLHASGVTVRGARSFPAPASVRVHQIEIPYGRFERNIALPVQSLGPARRQLVDGCLVITFSKRKDLV